MKEMIIAYGTETNNSEDLANRTAKRLKAKGFSVQVLDLEDFDLDDLEETEFLLLITSTYGEGDPPTNAEDFYEALMSDEACALHELSFSVCALGDTDYEHFCKCGQDFDERLAELGGRRFAPRVDCDTDFDDSYEEWWAGVERGLNSLNLQGDSSNISSGSSRSSEASASMSQEAPPPEPPQYERPPSPLSSGYVPQEHSQQPAPRYTPPALLQPLNSSGYVNPTQSTHQTSHQNHRSTPAAYATSSPSQEERTRVASLEGLQQEQSRNSEKKSKKIILRGTKKLPLFSELTENYNLNHPESEKETRHLTFSLKGAEVEYKVGDALGLYPRNDNELVMDILHFVGIDRDTRVMFEDWSYTCHYVLKYRKDIVKIDQRMIDLVLQNQPNPRLQSELSDRKKVKAYINDHHLLDLLQAAQIKLPPDLFINALRSLVPRLYSISSSPKQHIDEVQLTVDVLRYQLHGTTRRGVASNFLADAEVGTHAAVYIQATKEFTLCDPNAPMIMVGPGTGIAPFRAMLEEREATKAPGQSWLFFGAQRSSRDFLYREQLEGWVQNGVLSQLDCAWSRDQNQKVYVQDLMYNHGHGIWRWLEAGAYFYVCGDAKRMAKDVHKTLLRIISEHGRLGPEGAEQYMSQFKAQKRYRRDVY